MVGRERRSQSWHPIAESSVLAAVRKHDPLHTSASLDCMYQALFFCAAPWVLKIRPHI